LERPVENEELWRKADKEAEEVEDKLDALEAEKSDLVKALGEEFAKLAPLEQDIWLAFANANAADFDLDSSKLGREMGEKHNGGVPYTGVNIRVLKHRARTKLQDAMKARGFDLKSLGYGND
jgi:hypothetical protein